MSFVVFVPLRGHPAWSLVVWAAADRLWSSERVASWDKQEEGRRWMD